MLYSEFVEGTGCRDSQKNYEVYKNLEIMYMNSDMTKEQVYEYGKKLVDNSKTADEIELERKLTAELKKHKETIKELKNEIERYKEYLTDESDEYWIKSYKDDIKIRKIWIKQEKARIAEIKWILE